MVAGRVGSFASWVLQSDKIDQILECMVALRRMDLLNHKVHKGTASPVSLGYLLAEDRYLSYDVRIRVLALDALTLIEEAAASGKSLLRGSMK